MANKTSENILAKNRAYAKSEHGMAIRERLQAKYRHALRASIVALMGSRCSWCWYSDTRALQIDHINGGGHKERMQIKNTAEYYKVITESFINGEKKYQLLCANCNVIKRIINKEF